MLDKSKKIKDMSISEKSEYNAAMKKRKREQLNPPKAEKKESTAEEIRERARLRAVKGATRKTKKTTFSHL